MTGAQEKKTFFVKKFNIQLIQIEN